MSEKDVSLKDANVVWHPHSVDRASRERLAGHRGCVVWFTGLSGSGKSTIANLVDSRLHSKGVHTFLLDGDNIRHGLCASPQMLQAEHGSDFSTRYGLGFDAADREENIRRIGAVAQLFVSAAIVTLTAFVSPYRSDRRRVRHWVEQQGNEGDFIEVFVDTPLELCEQRDPKGLYKLARQGKISNFTGISDPYEPPEKPEIHLAAGRRSPDDLADEVVRELAKRGIG